MSEYASDPEYGKDDFGSTCRKCGVRSDFEADFCSLECEAQYRNDDNTEDPDRAWDDHDRRLDGS